MVRGFWNDIGIERLRCYNLWPFANRSGVCSLSDGQRKARDYFILAAALVLTVCICSLPILLYYTIVIGDHVVTTYSELGNCSFGYDTSAPSTDSPVSWSGSYTNGSSVGCTAERYTGSVCSQQLVVWQEYVFGRSDNVYLYVKSGESTQDERERDAAQFLYFLQSFGSEACQRTAAMFACQSFFPLCNCNDGGVYEASQEECDRLSMVECEEEWTSAQQYGINLPDCDSLPTETAAGPSSGGPMGPELPPLNITNLSCSEDFFEQNFTCLPHCDLWSHTSPAISLTVEIVDFLTTIVRMLASAMVVIIFVIRRKAILTFPTVFLVYLNIGFFIDAFFDLFSVIGGSKLFCSSRNLSESLENPTVYCTIQGSTADYFIFSGILCWIFHISFILYMLAFPLKAQKTKRYQKWIHLIFISLVVLVPALFIAVQLAIYERPYTVTEFPPRECTSSFNSNLLLIILNFIEILGICMFIIIAWIMHKAKRSEAEKKIIFILSYYILIYVYMIITYEVRLAMNPSINESVSLYLLCEATGHMVGMCSRESFEQIILPLLSCIASVLLMFFPIVNLAFLINFMEIRKRVKKLCQRSSESYTTNSVRKV